MFQISGFRIRINQQRMHYSGNGQNNRMFLQQVWAPAERSFLRTNDFKFSRILTTGKRKDIPPIDIFIRKYFFESRSSEPPSGRNGSRGFRRSSAFSSLFKCHDQSFFAANPSIISEMKYLQGCLRRMQPRECGPIRRSSPPSARSRRSFVFCYKSD